METKQIFLTIAILCVLGILFTPTNSNLWVVLLGTGIIFGVLWWKKN